MNLKDNEKRRLKRIIRTRKNISGTAEKPRLAVHRSLRQIYAQMIDDAKGVTVCCASSLSPEIKESIKGKKKSEQATMVGLKLAEIAKGFGVTKVVFDRHGYLYHGRIKSLAEGCRKGGLEF